jgi:uncharacterized membrane protein
MQTINAVFSTQDQAAHAIEELKAQQGLSERDVTVVARADDASLVRREQGAVERAQLQGSAWSGTMLGAAIGGFAGVILSSFAILPALPLLMVGGAALGALATRSVHHDVVDQQIDSAKAVLADGGAIVFVHSSDPATLTRAGELLRAAHATSVSEPVEDTRPLTT